MIALRLTTHGRSRDIRSDRREISLGSDPKADIAERGMGWARHEALLIHRGSEIELRRPGCTTDIRLRVGDTVHLGDAKVTLVGILPLEAEVTDPALVFGGYDEDWPAEQPFQLVSDLGSKAKTQPTEPSPARTSTADNKSNTDKSAHSGVGKPATGPDGKANARFTAAADKAKGPEHITPLSAYRPPDFGEELFRQLKRAPFFVVSVAVHALVFLVLSVFQSSAEGSPAPGEEGTLRASVQDLKDPQNATDEDFAEIEIPPALLLPAATPPPFPEDENDAPEVSDNLELEPLPDDGEPAPFTVGMNPSLSSAGARSGQSRARPSKGELSEGFGQAGAKSANQRAADYVRGRLGRGTGGDEALLRTLDRDDLLVVTGEFDHIGRVLHALRLPYILVPPVSMAATKAPDLSRHKIIFWNCGQSLPTEEQKRTAIRRLRTFVRKGGYLFTTDWAVSNVLAMAFPGYLGSSGARAPLPETVVSIQPGEGQRKHALLEGVFTARAQGRWWLERASYDVKVLRKNDVTVLIESPELKSRYKRSTAVAVTFPYGRGRVLHIMGHYFQEAGNLAGAISAQRLALNLVLMRLGKE